MPAELLLEVHNVLCKGVHGRLTLDADEVRWAPDADPSAAQSMRVASVKSTALSKPESGKPRLRVVAIDGSALVFDFSDVGGDASAEESWKQRDAFRDVLHQLSSTVPKDEPGVADGGGASTSAPVPSATSAPQPLPPQPRVPVVDLSADDGARAPAPSPPHAGRASSSSAQPASAAPSQPRAVAHGKAPVPRASRALTPPPAPPPAAVLERRQLVLQREPALQRLYEELVVSCVMDEAEFWAQHGAEEARYAHAALRDGPSSRRVSTLLDEARVQDDDAARGGGAASAAARADNAQIRINLTPALISQIFLEKPRVRETYEKTVPHKWTEQQFWQKYFKHQMFHKGSSGPGGGATAEDRDVQDLRRLARGEDAKEESADERRKRQLQLVRSVNPAHDLSKLDTDLADVTTLGDGGSGGAGSAGSAGGADASAGGANGSRAPGAGGFGLVPWTETEKNLGAVRASRSNFRKAVEPYLRHSERVMESSTARADALGAGAGLAAAENEALIKRRKTALHDATMEPDLVPEQPPDFVRRPEAMRHQPRADGAQGAARAAATEPAGDAAARQALLTAQLESWQAGQLLPAPPPQAAAGALKLALTSAAGGGGGGVANGGPDGDAQRATASLPAALRLESRALGIYQLLRHFWGALVPRTEHTDAKLARLAPALRREYDDLARLKEALPRDDRRTHVAAAIQPLMAMLERTFSPTA